MKGKREIEQSLQRAVLHTTPDVLEQVWRELDEGGQPELQLLPVQEARQAAKPKRPALRRAALALAACLLLLTGLLVGGYVNANLKVESVVGLDVNPSIELSTNSKNQVIDCKASNEDGRQILGEMNLKKVDLEVAVNAIIGSMFQQGYLKPGSTDNTILITVLNANQSKAASLQQELLGSVNGALNQNNAQARVICRQDADSDELRQLARRYGVSLSKADLIRDLQTLNPALNVGELSKMSIKELAELLDDLEDLMDDVHDKDPDDHHEKENSDPASRVSARPDPDDDDKDHDDEDHDDGDDKDHDDEEHDDENDDDDDKDHDNEDHDEDKDHDDDEKD